MPRLGLEEWTVIRYPDRGGDTVQTYSVYAQDADHAKEQAMFENEGWRFGQLDAIEGVVV